MQATSPPSAACQGFARLPLGKGRIQAGFPARSRPMHKRAARERVMLEKFLSRRNAHDAIDSFAHRLISLLFHFHAEPGYRRLSRRPRGRSRLRRSPLGRRESSHREAHDAQSKSAAHDKPAFIYAQMSSGRGRARVVMGIRCNSFEALDYDRARTAACAAPRREKARRRRIKRHCQLRFLFAGAVVPPILELMRRGAATRIARPAHTHFAASSEKSHFAISPPSREISRPRFMQIHADMPFLYFSSAASHRRLLYFQRETADAEKAAAHIGRTTSEAKLESAAAGGHTAAPTALVIALLGAPPERRLDNTAPSAAFRYARR